jgi:hypothetical protein
LPFRFEKGSRAALEGAAREHGGASRGHGGALREHRGAPREHRREQRGVAQGSLNWQPRSRLKFLALRSIILGRSKLLPPNLRLGGQ